MSDVQQDNRTEDDKKIASIVTQCLRRLIEASDNGEVVTPALIGEVRAAVTEALAPTDICAFCRERVKDSAAAAAHVLVCDKHPLKVALETAEELVAEAEKLLALIDAVGIDSKLGDETDRVFPRYEFDGLRAAVAKAKA